MSASLIQVCQQNNQEDIDLQPGLKLKKEWQNFREYSSFASFEDLA